MRIDNGQQLDIVYTTQSLLLVTPTDGQTSMFIYKNEPELSCFTPNTNDDDNAQFIVVTISILVGLVSGYIAVVHMCFKELCNTFGKLMIFYNLAFPLRSVSITALSIMHLKVTVNSWKPCYLIFFTFVQSIIVTDGFATCILAYLAYVMYQSYKCIQMTKETNDRFYKYSLVYVLGLLFLFDIYLVGYDFGTGAFKYALLPNGHCSYVNQQGYNTTVIIALAHTIYNKVIDILLLVFYFTYYYKFSKATKLVGSIANIDRQQNRMFFKIALTMAVTTGIIPTVFFGFNWFLDQGIFLSRVVGVVSLLIQQCVIMILFMCTEKMSRLCKERFSNRITPSITS